MGTCITLQWSRAPILVPAAHPPAHPASSSVPRISLTWFHASIVVAAHDLPHPCRWLAQVVGSSSQHDQHGDTGLHWGRGQRADGVSLTSMGTPACIVDREEVSTIPLPHSMPAQPRPRPLPTCLSIWSSTIPLPPSQGPALPPYLLEHLVDLALDVRRGLAGQGALHTGLVAAPRQGGEGRRGICRRTVVGIPLRIPVYCDLYLGQKLAPASGLPPPRPPLCAPEDDELVSLCLQCLERTRHPSPPLAHLKMTSLYPCACSALSAPGTFLLKNFQSSGPLAKGAPLLVLIRVPS